MIITKEETQQKLKEMIKAPGTGPKLAQELIDRVVFMDEKATSSGYAITMNTYVYDEKKVLLFIFVGTLIVKDPSSVKQNPGLPVRALSPAVIINTKKER